MTKKIVDAEESLRNLNFNRKEITVYLALLNSGTQTASYLAQKTNIPKATALFTLEKLAEKSFIKKSKKGRAFCFYADPSLLAETIAHQQSIQNNTLETLIPWLESNKQALALPPKITTFEGSSQCRQAYWKLLDLADKEIVEVGLNKGLAEAFGHNFVDQFIEDRNKLNIATKIIASSDVGLLDISRKSKAQNRTQRYLPEDKSLFSAISIAGNGVLIMNFYENTFGVLIENAELASTLKTLFEHLYETLPTTD